MEEELLLVDPGTRRIGSRSPQVIKAFREHGAGRHPSVAEDDVDKELFRHQVETRTRPVTDVAEILEQVVAARRYAAEAAERAGLAVVASGTPPVGGVPLEVTDNDRYRTMMATYGRTATYGGTCGMHVHVSVASDEEGVAVIDRILPWLPVLVAVAVNSPFADGEDTGYASWRSESWGRWPSAVPTAPFGTVDAYRAATAFLIESGAAVDDGMLYLGARLSADHPTVEVRVADVCTDPADALLVAALARGLVETAAREAASGGPAEAWRAEALRACHWRAARYGVAEALVDPRHRRPAPARDVLDALVGHVGAALEEAGDGDLVAEGLTRLGARSGATLQRAAHERTGSAEGVVDDLIERTRASWDS